MAKRKKTTSKVSRALVETAIEAQLLGVVMTFGDWVALDPEERLAWAAARRSLLSKAGEIAEDDAGPVGRNRFPEGDSGPFSSEHETPPRDPELRAVLEAGPSAMDALAHVRRSAVAAAKNRSGG